MPAQLWWVLAPLIAAFIIAAGRGFVRVNRWVVGLIAKELVSQIGDHLREPFEQAIDDRLAPIYAELSLNDGASLKDMVVQIRDYLRLET